MDVQQFFLILRARWRIFAATLFGLVLIVLIGSLLWPKTYTGIVTVVVDAKGTDPITGAILPSDMLPGFTATQVDIITSHNVALKVVDRLKLTDSPVVQDLFNEDTGGQGSIRDWLADQILLKLDVRPSRESNSINIQFNADDPAFAADMANAFGEAYIQATLELKVDPSRRQSQWFDQQVKGLRANLEKAQLRLSDYQRNNGIAGADDRLDVEAARLAEISNQLVAAQATTYDAVSRMRQVTDASNQRRLGELPDIIGNPLLQSMKADLVRAQGKLALTAERFDKNHPEYISAAAEVDELKNKLDVEINTAKGSIKEAAQLATQREEELRQSLERQKAHILELKHGRDQQDVFSREVDNAQRAYDVVVGRSTQVGMESRLDQSNIAVLNPAIVPLKPSKPKLLLNLVLAVFFGGVFGLGAALWSELVDRRIRGQRDFGDILGLPVLAELPAPKTARPKGWRQLALGHS